MGTQPPSPKRGRSPSAIFGQCLFGQTAGWIKVALGMEVGLSPGHIVLDGDPATSCKEGILTPAQFLDHVYCGQMAGWMKTPRGTEVDLGPCHIVLDGVPPLRERGTAAPLFLAHVYCGHGRPSQLLLSSCRLFFHHRFFNVPGAIFAKLCRTMQCVLKYSVSYMGVHTCSLEDFRGNPIFRRFPDPVSTL